MKLLNHVINFNILLSYWVILCYWHICLKSLECCLFQVDLIKPVSVSVCQHFGPSTKFSNLVRADLSWISEWLTLELDNRHYQTFLSGFWGNLNEICCVVEVDEWCMKVCCMTQSEVKRSWRSEMCEMADFKCYVSTPPVCIIKRLTVNYDIRRQHLNFDWTNFWYLSSFGIFKTWVFHLWQTNFAFYEEATGLAVPYRAYILLISFSLLSLLICCDLLHCTYY